METRNQEGEKLLDISLRNKIIVLDTWHKNSKNHSSLNTPGKENNQA